EKVDDSRSQLETLERLAGLAGHDVSFTGLGEDPSAAMDAVKSFGARVGWSPTVEPRRVPVSGRQARRLWRALDHTWGKLQRQARMSRVRHAVLTGRGALASRIEPADFRSDVLTAATITYL